MKYKPFRIESEHSTQEEAETAAALLRKEAPECEVRVRNYSRSGLINLRWLVESKLAGG